MTFQALSQYFEKLEKETKRNELVAVLADLFKEAKIEEIDKICYLMQGRIAPFYQALEIGMAEKMVAESIGRAFGKTKKEVLKIYAKLGDLGLAAGELAVKIQSKKSKGKNLTVSDVFETLTKIAKTSGAGSVEAKVSHLSAMLGKLDPLSAKYLARIPLSNLRLGIGDPTVLDALSVAKNNNKSLRPVLEEAYNKTSDLGFVAKIFWKEGEEAVKEMKLQLGKPVRPSLAERLPNAKEIIKRVGNKFAVEPKIDGFRNQVHLNHGEVKIFSRNLEDMTNMFPDLVKGVKEEVEAQTAIFEGEAVAYNPLTGEFYPFQETTKRRRKYDILETAEKLPLKLFAFDLLYLDGKDLTGKPYSQRRKLLEKIVKKNGERILVAEQKILQSEEKLINAHQDAVSRGLEGVMVKKLDAPYRAGSRGFHWIKFKRAQAGQLTDTIDCVILGYILGRGKRTAFGAGALLAGVYDEGKDEFVTICRIGTGLTDEEWRQIEVMGKNLKISHKPARVNSQITPSVWLEPKIVIEVFADEITRSPVHTTGKIGSDPGYALRFPRLISFRGQDKRPEDATTVSEIEKMYKMQFKGKNPK